MPNVTSCQFVGSALLYSEAQVYYALLQSTSAINNLVCLCLCCVVNVRYVSILCYQVKPVQTMCTLWFLLTSNGEKMADEAIGVKKGGFMWYFSLPSTSISIVYLWC